MVQQLGSAEDQRSAAERRQRAGRAKYWLTVGIPTVPRKTPNTTYLTTTLETLHDELPLEPLGWFELARLESQQGTGSWIQWR